MEQHASFLLLHKTTQSERRQEIMPAKPGCLAKTWRGAAQEGLPGKQGVKRIGKEEVKDR